ncbi:MAG TPA: hypothetical protein DCX41_04745 [Aequorivita sp.]|nr:hypothetical protein [Aequorivita sp.]
MQNKGEGKADTVLKALESKLVGFVKNESKSENENIFYSKSKTEVQIRKGNDSKVWIIVSETNDENNEA